MQVKKMFLSMCAIAMLASCSQNEDVPAPESNALPAKVTVRFTGDGTETRAVGTDDAKVNNLAALFFNSDGVRVGAVEVLDEVTSNTLTFTSTTDAKQVVLIANSDIRNDLKSVNNIDELKKKVESSVKAPGSGNDYAILQTKDNLTMSGYGTVTLNDETGEGSASVSLHFLAAKLRSIKVLFSDKNKGQYGDGGSLSATNGKWFNITAAYLMMVQTNSSFLPNGDLTTWKGVFTPNAYAYAGGMAWGGTEGPWGTPPAETNPVLASGYKMARIPKSEMIGTKKGVDLYSSTGGKANDRWYLFENSSANPTGIILEVKCLFPNVGTSGYTGKTRYFTLYFGEKGAAAAQPKIEAGKQYDITIGINADFEKTFGGGGTEDPTKPSVDANVSITVSPANWDAEPVTMSKDFNDE